MVACPHCFGPEMRLCFKVERAWWSKAVYLMAAWKQRERRETSYIFQRHTSSDLLPSTRPHLIDEVITSMIQSPLNYTTSYRPSL
jgi:hypothetical protein